MAHPFLNRRGLILQWIKLLPIYLLAWMLAGQIAHILLLMLCMSSSNICAFFSTQFWN